MRFAGGANNESSRIRKGFADVDSGKHPSSQSKTKTVAVRVDARSNNLLNATVELELMLEAVILWAKLWRKR